MIIIQIWCRLWLKVYPDRPESKLKATQCSQRTKIYKIAADQRFSEAHQRIKTFQMVKMRKILEEFNRGLIQQSRMRYHPWIVIEDTSIKSWSRQEMQSRPLMILLGCFKGTLRNLNSWNKVQQFLQSESVETTLLSISYQRIIQVRE